MSAEPKCARCGHVGLPLTYRSTGKTSFPGGMPLHEVEALCETCLASAATDSQPNDYPRTPPMNQPPETPTASHDHVGYPEDAVRLYSEERNAGKSPADARAFVEAGGALTPDEANAIDAYERSR